MRPYTPGSSASASVPGHIEVCAATERQAHQVVCRMMLHLLSCPRCAAAFARLKDMPVVAKAWPEIATVLRLHL